MVTSSGRALIDTNVLVYAFDASEPRKRQIADTLIADLDPAKVALSAQVLNEFYVTVTRKLSPPLEADHAERVVHWLGGLTVVPVDTELVMAGIGRSRASQLSLWDSLVVEAARRAGCTHVLTEDLDHGSVFDGVEIVNPFAPASP